MTFVINYYKSAVQANLLAVKLQRLYPGCVTLLIEDNPRIKVMSHGGEWTQRWMERALAAGGDPIIKVDPDIQATQAAKAIPTAAMFGCVLTRMDGSTQVHGGTFGLSRVTAQKIVDSKLLLDEKYKTPYYTYDWNGETVSYQDRITADVYKQLGIKPERWHEVWMQFHQSPYDPKQHAFIHPRFEQFAVIEVEEQ